jgi:HNH endonuclease
MLESPMNIGYITKRRSLAGLPPFLIDHGKSVMTKHEISPPILDAKNLIWKKIPSFPALEASHLGHIRRISFTGRWAKRCPEGNIYHTFTKLIGYTYYKVFIFNDGQKKHHLRVNRLVCEAFQGLPPSPQHHAAHDNGDSLDNRADNLAWKTAQQNIDDRGRHGRHPCGERQGHSRFKDEDILRIRSMHSSGSSLAEIGKMFGACKGTLSAIVRRKSWKHLP